jgi:flagellar basal-body rod modification protein FlgD
MSAPIGTTQTTSSGTNANSSGQAFAPAQLGEQAFLQLLIAELKNQDPNQPMDGQTMITQLAQLNQTQASIQSASYQEESFASNLIGQSVTGTAGGKIVTGTASSVSINGSTVTVQVNGQPMDVSTITQVGGSGNTATAPTTPSTPTGGQA